MTGGYYSNQLYNPEFNTYNRQKGLDPSFIKGLSLLS